MTGEVTRQAQGAALDGSGVAAPFDKRLLRGQRFRPFKVGAGPHPFMALKLKVYPTGRPGQAREVNVRDWPKPDPPAQGGMIKWR